MTTTIIVLAVFLGLIPAVIAQRKGHSFITWWIAGVLLLIVALPLALFAKDKRPRCPECREVVQKEATRCPHCQSEIAGRVVVYQTPSPGPGPNYQPPG